MIYKKIAVLDASGKVDSQISKKTGGRLDKKDDNSIVFFGQSKHESLGYKNGRNGARVTVNAQNGGFEKELVLGEHMRTLDKKMAPPEGIALGKGEFFVFHSVGTMYYVARQL